jgi:opacity protein-like surface antigen
MRKIGLILIVLLFSQTAFAAENTEFYFGFYGGYLIPQTMTMSERYYGNTDATLENGYLVGVKSGWLTPFTNKIMAMEMEYNYIFDADFDKSKVVNLAGRGLNTLDGNIRVHAFLFNIKARYPEGLVHPYAGFGLGYSYFQMGDITARLYGTGFVIDIIPGGSGGAFCYQFIAGLDLDIAPHMSLGIGYKYFVARPTIKKDTFWGNDYDLDYRASIISLGLTFTF